MPLIILRRHLIQAGALFVIIAGAWLGGMLMQATDHPQPSCTAQD